jgi:D-arginine dehydrogenase
MCPVLDPAYVAGGLVEPDARDIDVHALHQGFLRGIRARGGHISTTAPVTSLALDDATWTIQAGSATYQAAAVVNAAGAWADVVGSMAGLAPIGLTPKRRTAFTFGGPEGHSRWPMVVDMDEQFYFKPEGPAILASPCDETPMAPCDIRHEELDVAVGIERVQAATTLRIRHVKSAWAGLRSFVPDHRPVVGEDAAAPGFFWLAGQGGFGIKTSPAMARAVTGLICDRSLPDDLIKLGITAADLAPGRLERTSR